MSMNFYMGYTLHYNYQCPIKHIPFPVIGYNNSNKINVTWKLKKTTYQLHKYYV